MSGMHQSSGKTVSDRTHLQQSIRDILTTPLGTRVMRPNYGSRLFDLVDQPIDRALRIEIYVATSEAIRRWEPRFQITRMAIDAIESGQITLILEGRYRPDGRLENSETLRLEGIQL